MFRTVAGLITNLAWLSLLIYLLNSGPWVTSGIANSVNPLIALSLQLSVLVSAVITLLEARPLLRLWRERRK